MRTLVTCLALSITMSALAPLRAQTLAEVAKQEEERRKNAKSSGKVYTNDNLKPVADPPPGAAASAQPTPGAADAAATADAHKDDNTPATAATPAAEVKDRAYWSKRMNAAREQLERDRVLTEALQSRVNALTADFTGRDDPAQRARVATERDKAVAELERMKASVLLGRKAIADLEEEARRAGVAPGWLR